MVASVPGPSSSGALEGGLGADGSVDGVVATDVTASGNVWSTAVGVGVTMAAGLTATGTIVAAVGTLGDDAGDAGADTSVGRTSATSGGSSGATVPLGGGFVAGAGTVPKLKSSRC